MSLAYRLSSACWCLVAFLLSAGVASADVIVVDGSTRAAIQDALNMAVDGDTVLIPPGQYLIEAAEMLLMPRDGVTLQGSGADQTVLYRDVDTTNTVML